MGGWKDYRLDELCSIDLGRTPSRDRPHLWDKTRSGTNVWLSIADLQEQAGGVVTDSKEYVSDHGAALCKIVRAGTLLLSFKLTIGRMAVAGRDLYTNEAIAALGIRQPDRLDRSYLRYFLEAFDWAKATEGDHKIKGKTLNKAKLRELRIRVPPLTEQRRIVAILDEAFEGIATAKVHAEKNLQNAREVFELQRTVIFSENQGSWPRKLLGEVATVQSGGTPLVSTGEFWGGSIAWYSSGELNDLITREPERFITEAGLASSNAKLFPEGSLLVGMYDTAALKMSLLHRPAAFNQAIAGVMPNASLETEFLLHAINVQKLQLLGLRRGVRQKNLSLGKIKEIMIPLPSPRVQREIVERLRDAGARSAQLEDVYRRKLAALDELKQSLLHQAFSGQL